MNVSHSPDIKGPSVISLTVTGCKPHLIKPKNPTYGIRALFTWWPNISASPLSDLIHLLMPDSVFLFGNFITDFIQINFCSSSISLLFSFTEQQPSDGQAGQQTGPSRVAAVGPYIQSSTMPRGPMRHELLVKPAYPDGTATLPSHDPQSKASAGD